MRISIGRAKKNIERMRELRLICAYVAGKQPHEIFSLPGDFKNIPLRTAEERLELAKKFGVYEKWGLDKN